MNVSVELNKIINSLSAAMPEGTAKSEFLKGLYSLNYTISTAKDLGSCFGILSGLINQRKGVAAF